MRLTYHGTAAAEGWPALFCECDNCNRARKAGGRNIRTRSQADIDGRLLIDFPADTYMHILHGKLDLLGIRTIIFTHAHEDHFYPTELFNRYTPYAHVYSDETLPIKVYGNERVMNALRVHVENHNQKNIYQLIQLENFVEYRTDGYIITPLAAHHDHSQSCHIFIISDGRKTMLYGNDTGYFPEATWDYIKSSGVKFDFVSLDTTNGLLDGRDYHMGISAAKDVRDRLIDGGAAHSCTKFCLHHFSHNGKAIYDELVPIAGEIDFDVSYDGKVAEI